MDSPEELEATEAMLRFMYQRRLPDGTSQQQLVTMLQLADKYDVQPCTAACGACLSKQDLEWDALNCILQLPAAYSESPLFSSLFSKAGDLLQQQLGDLEEIWASSEGRERFLALPLKGVELLLGDKRTRVASENTVLVAATLWVQQHSNSLSEGAKKRLAELIRLPYLTPLYASGMLLSLPWLVSAVGMARLMAAVGVGHAMNTTTRSAQPAMTEGLEYPASWSLGQRPMSHRRQASIKLCLHVDQLKTMYEGGDPHTAPPMFFAGLEWTLRVNYTATPPGTAPAAGAGNRGAISVDAIPHIPSSVKRTPERVLLQILQGCITCHAGNATAANVSKPLAGGKFIAAVGYGWGCNLWAVHGSDWPADKFAKFADADGKLTLQLTVSKFI